jgi:hypothetical protein
MPIVYFMTTPYYIVTHSSLLYVAKLGLLHISTSNYGMVPKNLFRSPLDLASNVSTK